MHCGHRVNTLFTCLSTYLALRSIRNTFRQDDARFAAHSIKNASLVGLTPRSETEKKSSDKNVVAQNQGCSSSSRRRTDGTESAELVKNASLEAKSKQDGLAALFADDPVDGGKSPKGRDTEKKFADAAAQTGNGEEIRLPAPGEDVDTMSGNRTNGHVSSLKEIKNGNAATRSEYFAGNEPDTRTSSKEVASAGGDEGCSAVASSSQSPRTQNTSLCTKFSDRLPFFLRDFSLCVRMLIRQALQRIARQSPVMLFWSWVVMQVMNKDVPWRPSETMNVWYDYRVKVCNMSLRWLYSSFYLHAWLTENIHDESVCHNTAIFEAEFQVVILFVLFVCASHYIRRRFLSSPSETTTSDEEPETDLQFKSSCNFARSVLVTGLRFAELSILVHIQKYIIHHAWEHATSRDDTRRWAENQLLERSPRTLLYLLSVAIGVYIFEEALPDLLAHSPLMAGARCWQRCRRRKYILEASVAVAKDKDINMSIKDEKSKTVPQQPAPVSPAHSTCTISRRAKPTSFLKLLIPAWFRLTFFVVLPLLVVLFLDAMVVLRGRYFIIANEPSVVERMFGVPVFHFLWGHADIMLKWTSEYLQSEPMLMDYLLDFPTTFAFYHLLKLILEADNHDRGTTASRRTNPPGEQEQLLGSSGPRLEEDTRRAISSSASNIVFRQATHLVAQLCFGMNLSNIFVLHYLVSYGLQFPLRINYILFPSIYGFVVGCSAVVNIFVYLFIEKPCANMAARLFLVHL
ncbi:unnamed protein product [Amoebophrya sp. A25]|nr:unnamed protein product [Amoebophrya sp. A25]|eukprot:GSA25T00013480001.1